MVLETTSQIQKASMTFYGLSTVSERLIACSMDRALYVLKVRKHIFDLIHGSDIFMAHLVIAVSMVEQKRFTD